MAKSVSARDVLIPESQFEQAKQKLLKPLQTLKRGEQGFDLGVWPVIDEKHAARLMSLLTKQAVRSGNSIMASMKASISPLGW